MGDLLLSAKSFNPEIRDRFSPEIHDHYSEIGNFMLLYEEVSAYHWNGLVIHDGDPQGLFYHALSRKPVIEYHQYRLFH